MFFTVAGMNVKSEGAKERVLGTFDEAKVIRKMHDAGEIGVREFDQAAVAEVKMLGDLHEDFVGVQAEIVG